MGRLDVRGLVSTPRKAIKKILSTSLLFTISLVSFVSLSGWRFVPDVSKKETLFVEAPEQIVVTPDVSSKDEIPKFVTDFNKRELVDKITDLFGWTFSLDATFVDQFKAEKENSDGIAFLLRLKQGYAFKGSDESSEKYYHWRFASLENLPEKIMTHLPIAGDDEGEIEDYVQKFTKIEDINQKIAQLFGSNLTFSSDNTKSIVATLDNLNRKQINFVVSLKPGHCFADGKNEKTYFWNYLHNDFFSLIVDGKNDSKEKFVKDFNLDWKDKFSTIIKENSFYKKDKIKKIAANLFPEKSDLICFRIEFIDPARTPVSFDCNWVKQDTFDDFWEGLSEQYKTFCNPKFDLKGKQLANIPLQYLDFHELIPLLREGNIYISEKGWQSSIDVNIVKIVKSHDQSSDKQNFNLEIQLSVDTFEPKNRSVLPNKLCFKNCDFGQAITKDALSVFNKYVSITNDKAVLVDSVLKALVVHNSSDNYALINLKSVLRDISDPLSKFVVDDTLFLDWLTTTLTNWGGGSLIRNYEFPREKVKKVLKGIFENKPLSQIIGEILSWFSVLPSDEKNGLTDKVSGAFLDIIAKLPKMISNGLTLDLPLTGIATEPLRYVAEFSDNLFKNINLLELLKYIPFDFLLKSDFGVLDIFDKCLAIILNNTSAINELVNLVSNSKKDSFKKTLNDIKKMFYSNFNSADINEIVYWNFPDESDLRINKNVDRTGSVGFNISKCIYRHLVSKDFFVRECIVNLIKEFDVNFENSCAQVKINDDLIQKMAVCGLIVDKKNTGRYINFRLNKNSDNPFFEIWISTNKVDIKTDVTYISVSNLDKYNNYWLNDSECQGGIFDVSLYNHLIGNKDFMNVVLNFINCVFPEKITDDQLEGLRNFIENSGISGKNVYNCLSEIISKMEDKAMSDVNKYKFAQLFVTSFSEFPNSPELTYDKLKQQYVFIQSYEFKLTSEILIDFKPFKELVGEKLSLGDLANLLQKFSCCKDFVNIIALGPWVKISSCFNDKLVIPQSLGFDNSIYLKLVDLLMIYPKKINLIQKIYFDKLTDFFDNIFGFNVGKQNEGEKKFLITFPFLGKMLRKAVKEVFYNKGWIVKKNGDEHYSFSVESQINLQLCARE